MHDMWDIYLQVRNEYKHVNCSLQDGVIWYCKYNQTEPMDLMYIIPDEEQIALILWYRTAV